METTLNILRQSHFNTSTHKKIISLTPSPEADVIGTAEGPGAIGVVTGDLYQTYTPAPRPQGISFNDVFIDKTQTSQIGRPIHNPNFTGRIDELAKLETCLKESGIVAVTSAGRPNVGAAATESPAAAVEATTTEAIPTVPQPVVGLGGVGKTQLALEYSYRHQEKYRYIAWLNGKAGVGAGFLRIAESLLLPTKGRKEQEIIDMVRNKLSSVTGWLIVVDDVDDDTDWQKYLPGTGGHIIMTSRNLHLKRGTAGLNLDVLNLEDSIELLRKTIEAGEPQGLDDAQLGELAELLGKLPLALVQAGSYIRETGNSVAEYIQLFRETRQTLIDESQPIDYDYTVATTWTISIADIRRKHATLAPMAEQLLEGAAYYASDNILEVLLINVAIPEDSKQDVLAKHRYAQAKQVVLKYSLITVHTQIGTVYTYAMHQLLQGVVRDGVDNRGETEVHIARGVGLLKEGYKWGIEVKDDAFKESFIPHTEVVMEHALRYRCCEMEAAELGGHVGRDQQHYSHFQAALQVLEQVKNLLLQHYGTEDHANVGNTYIELGNIYRIQGEYEKAKSYYEKALRVLVEKCETESHVSVSVGFIHTGLGNLYGTQGEYELAKDHYEKALRVYIAEYGTENHTEVGKTYSNLGNLYETQGEHELAKKHHEKALMIYITKCGTENHVDVGGMHVNLGNLYETQGEYELARAHYEEALRIYIAEYETEDHVNVGMIHNDLGELYRTQEEFVLAKTHYEKALRIYIIGYGTEDHVDIGKIYNNLGLLYQAQGEYALAKTYYEKALRIYVIGYGTEDHADIGKVHGNLGLLCQVQWKYGPAEIHYEKALRIYIAAYGTENHVDVGKTYNNLGLLCPVQGEYELAKTYYEKALDILTTGYGTENHADVGRTHNNLGLLYQAQGEYALAKIYYEEALKIHIAAYGTENHTEVGGAYGNLGSLFEKMGNTADALKCHRKALQIFQAKLPPTHQYIHQVTSDIQRCQLTLQAATQPDDAELQLQYAQVLSQSGKKEDALAIYDRLIDSDSENVAALFGKANVLDDLDRRGDALVSLNRALTLFPVYDNALYLKGYVLMKLGDCPKQLKQ